MFWKFIERFGKLIAIIAAFAAITTFFLRRTESPLTQIDIRENSRTKLTDLPKINGFEFLLKYKDSTINNLWKYEITLLNSGNTPIIGKGNLKNVLDSVVSLSLSSNFKILNLDILENDPKGVVKQVQVDKLQLSFDQWKPKEKISLSLLIDAKANDTITPVIALDDRMIINLKVNFRTVNNQSSITAVNNPVKKYIKDYAGSTIYRISKWTAIVLSFVFVFFPFFFFGEIYKIVALNNWKKNNTEKIRILLDKFEFTPKEKFDYLNSPGSAPGNIWNEWEGKIPSFNVMDWWSLSLAFLFTIFICIGFLLSFSTLYFEI